MKITEINMFNVSLFREATREALKQGMLAAELDVGSSQGQNSRLLLPGKAKKSLGNMYRRGILPMKNYHQEQVWLANQKGAL